MTYSSRRECNNRNGWQRSSVGHRPSVDARDTSKHTTLKTDRVRQGYACKPIYASAYIEGLLLGWYGGTDGCMLISGMRTLGKRIAPGVQVVCKWTIQGTQTHYIDNERWQTELVVHCPGVFTSH